MRTTVKLDHELLVEAQRLFGITEREVLVNEGMRNETRDIHDMDVVRRPLPAWNSDLATFESRLSPYESSLILRAMRIGNGRRS